MKLTANELGEIIAALASLESEELGVDYTKILTKLSKELKRLGFTTIVSKHYLKEV